METLFNVPVTPGTSQFVPENEKYPTKKTETAQRISLPNTPNHTINYLNYSHDVNQGKGAAIHPDIAQATG